MHQYADSLLGEMGRDVRGSVVGTVFVADQSTRDGRDYRRATLTVRQRTGGPTHDRRQAKNAPRVAGYLPPALRLSSGPRLQSSSNLETPTDAGRHRTRLRTSEMAQAP
jgi:hypothetical protein